MTDRPIPFSRRLDELEARVRERSDLVPRLGMVLGSGLGDLADEIDDPVAIPFEDMPGWPAPSVPGHSGRLLLGTLRELPVACLRGRLHMYEGLSERLVVEPALLMGRLGAPILLLTNASGGVNPAFGAGTLMVMRDHINLTGRNPLDGPQRRCTRTALPGHDRGLGRRVARAPARCGSGRGRGAQGGHLPRSDGPHLRDARGGAHDRQPRRGRGGHVHGDGGNGGATGPGCASAVSRS